MTTAGSKHIALFASVPWALPGTIQLLLIRVHHLDMTKDELVPACSILPQQLLFLCFY